MGDKIEIPSPTAEKKNIPLPKAERQIRPLTHLEPEKQKEVWQKAVKTAPGGAALQSIVASRSGDRGWSFSEWTPWRNVEILKLRNTLILQFGVLIIPQIIP